tara:strand:- start:17898 stop:18959 length:1062 start_codon:yes stop_codon:yes gene_type:complete
MDDDKKNSIINRITTGIVYLNIKNTLYHTSMPTIQQRALSELVYRETLDNSKYSELITRNQAKNFLASKGIWTPQNDQELEKLNKYLEDLKIQLYDALYKDKEKKNLRRRISSVRSGINKSIIKKYSLDHITLESHAENARDEFLIATTIRDTNGKFVYSYENWSKIDNYVLQRFLNFLMSNIITPEEQREIARSEPFRSRWSIYGTEIFSETDGHSSDQNALLMYSKMYDNVYEHPERPSDDVIKDDDMLDGWFAKQRRKSEKERSKKELDDILDKKGVNKDGGAGEMFVVASSKSEAEKIRGVNDLNERIRMRQRSDALQKKGRLDEHELPDVQRELQSQAMKQMADRFKK